MKVEEVRRVGVLGAGTMGHGIAEVAALAGFEVDLYDVQKTFIESGIEMIRWSVSKLVQKGFLSPTEAEEALGRIHGTPSLDDFANVDIVIEAVPEDLATKTEVFSQIDRLNKHAMLASNTSTIPIGEIGASTSRPENCVGMHFFNPPILMPIVEIIRSKKTDDETLEAAMAFARKLGKEVVVCNKDVPGFIVNRILCPLLGEAGWIVARGQATIEQVDSAAVFKAGLPMGLFELADFTGIDVIYKASESMKSREPTSLLNAPLVKEKFSQGKLGKKSGEGFYVYAGASSRPTVSRDAGKDVDPLLFFSVAVNAAAWLIRNGVCSRQDIDSSVKLGLGFPEGLLQMSDRWGVDRIVSILREKESRYGADYAPDPFLEEMLRRGELGVASGKGFYEYAKDQEKKKQLLMDIVLTKSPPLAWISLNRPHRLNTITPRLVDELEQVARDVASDGSIRVIILRGEGGRAFSAGADLTTFSFSAPDKAFDLVRRMFEVFALFERMPKPVIAAIDGFALGGGCELALACDFRLASESSQIGLTETNLGILPGAGGTQRLIKMVGLAKAKKMIFFGSKLTAEEALNAGLFDRVFAKDEFEKGVEEFALALAKRAPLSLKFAKIALNMASQVPTDLGQYFEATSFALLTGTADATEGVTSFFSKKEPEFKGE